MDEEPKIVRGVTDHTLRCDGLECGALALYSTWVNMTELNWCAHHFRQGGQKLIDAASLIIDRTEE